MAESKTREKKVHHGRNMRFAREFWHTPKMTQEDLALKIGIHQKDISRLEGQEIIEDAMLYKVSEALDVPFQFLKECPLDENVRKIVENHDNSHTFHDSSSENIGNEQEINLYDTENAQVYMKQISALSQELGRALAERDIYQDLYEEMKKKRQI